MQWKQKTLRLILLVTSNLSLSAHSMAEDLLVGKSCPVTYKERSVGILVFSREWYHTSRSDAHYTPGDNATGIGLEIHFFSNDLGDTRILNLPDCDRYRMLQIRSSNARMLPGEHLSQVDVPDQFITPFYDHSPLEHGHGVHLAPADDRDKPWSGRPVRASTVSIYDSPYVSDAWGREGHDITIRFETCVVCQRDRRFDQLLSCGTWGYQRHYMGGMTGWAEPEFIPPKCLSTPTKGFQQTLNDSNRIDYSYWINWR